MLKGRYRRKRTRWIGTPNSPKARRIAVRNALVKRMNSGKWHEQRAFLEERKKWYAKLKKEGFDDIENIEWNTGASYECLNGVSNADVCDSWTHGKERYYQLANQFLWELRKRASRDRRRKSPERKDWGRVLRIWKLHAEGASIRDIVKKVGFYRSGVHKVVVDMRTEMLAWHQEEGGE